MFGWLWDLFAAVVADVADGTRGWAWVRAFLVCSVATGLVALTMALVR